MLHSILFTMLTFAELKSKPFIQRALANPSKPGSVLSYFFAVDYDETAKYKDTMLNSAGTVFDDNQRFWFMQSDEYDELCKPFTPLIRQVGNKEGLILKEEEEEWWNGIDGIMSKILLCDQLARNCFRGQNEAYQYDSVAEDLSLVLIEDYYSKLQLNNDKENTDPGATSFLPGTYYAPYVAFMSLPLMHSEKLSSHERGLQVLDSALLKYNDDEGTQRALKVTYDSLLEHTDVIKRFGRYPHRNVKLGRQSTPEEQSWLDDIDNMPGWAKSQLL